MSRNLSLNNNFGALINYTLQVENSNTKRKNDELSNLSITDEKTTNLAKKIKENPSHLSLKINKNNNFKRFNEIVNDLNNNTFTSTFVQIQIRLKEICKLNELISIKSEEYFEIVKFITETDFLNSIEKIELLNQCISIMNHDDVINHSAYFQLNKAMNLLIKINAHLVSNKILDTNKIQFNLTKNIENKVAFLEEYYQPQYLIYVIAMQKDLKIDHKTPEEKKDWEEKISAHLNRFIQLIEFNLKYKAIEFDLENYTWSHISNRKHDEIKFTNFNAAYKIINHFNIHQLEQLIVSVLESSNSFSAKYYFSIIQIINKLILKFSDSIEKVEKVFLDSPALPKQQQNLEIINKLIDKLFKFKREFDQEIFKCSNFLSEEQKQQILKIKEDLCLKCNNHLEFKNKNINLNYFQ